MPYPPANRLSRGDVYSVVHGIQKTETSFWVHKRVSSHKRVFAQEHDVAMTLAKAVDFERDEETTTLGRAHRGEARPAPFVKCILLWSISWKDVGGTNKLGPGQQSP
jgi:hypothetical protein